MHNVIQLFSFIVVRFLWGISFKLCMKTKKQKVRYTIIIDRKKINVTQFMFNEQRCKLIIVVCKFLIVNENNSQRKKMRIECQFVFSSV